MSGNLQNTFPNLGSGDLQVGDPITGGQMGIANVTGTDLQVTYPVDGGTMGTITVPQSSSVYQNSSNTTGTINSFTFGDDASNDTYDYYSAMMVRSTSPTYNGTYYEPQVILLWGNNNSNNYGSLIPYYYAANGINGGDPLLGQNASFGGGAPTLTLTASSVIKQNGDNMRVQKIGLCKCNVNGVQNCSDNSFPNSVYSKAYNGFDYSSRTVTGDEVAGGVYFNASDSDNNPRQLALALHTPTSADFVGNPDSPIIPAGWTDASCNPFDANDTGASQGNYKFGQVNAPITSATLTGGQINPMWLRFYKAVIDAADLSPGYGTLRQYIATNPLVKPGPIAAGVSKVLQEILQELAEIILAFAAIEVIAVYASQNQNIYDKISTLIETLQDYGTQEVIYLKDFAALVALLATETGFLNRFVSELGSNVPNPNQVEQIQTDANYSLDLMGQYVSQLADVLKSSQGVFRDDISELETAIITEIQTLTGQNMFGFGGGHRDAFLLGIERRKKSTTSTSSQTWLLYALFLIFIVIVTIIVCAMLFRKKCKGGEGE